MVRLALGRYCRLRRSLPSFLSSMYLFIVMSSNSRLRRLLAERSVKSGDFTLASGRRSRYYVDARLTTMRGEGQVLVGEVCWHAIQEAGWAPDFVGGMTLGADPVAYAIANHATRSGRTLDAFTVRKEPKGHGTGRQIEGGLPAGAKVVVVDDTVTSGGSLLASVQVVVRHGAIVVGVLALVDREEGGRELLRGAGYDLRAVFAARDLV